MMSKSINVEAFLCSLWILLLSCMWGQSLSTFLGFSAFLPPTGSWKTKQVTQNTSSSASSKVCFKVGIADPSNFSKASRFLLRHRKKPNYATSSITFFRATTSLPLSFNDCTNDSFKDGSDKNLRNNILENNMVNKTRIIIREWVILEVFWKSKCNLLVIEP